ncbi:MAG: glycosyltransferase family 2 protein [Candidatus Accumulibacter sp.]|jgi:glycosyltransferase involved in cell wall biosynthesis|nr:glycosyltransferase family 2 protein [Accumulibacter sp.]
MKTVAIVPVFDHGATVGAVAATLRAHGLPVILVDDGSHAPCAQTLDALLAAGAARDWPPLVLLRHTENRGKGAAVLTGLVHAQTLGATHAVQVDADGQHDLEALPAFLEASAANPRAVINGCPRYDDSVSRGRLYGRYLTHLWVWINTLSLRIADSMCGFRVYPLAAVMPLLPALRHAKRMDFDPEILVRLDWAAVPIVNLPVRVRYPADGLSHFQPWRDNLRISAMHARLFFGMLRRCPRLLAWHVRGNRV